MSHYFITASGTGVGKTLVTTTLCWQLRQRGKKVTALKPVITGFDPEDETSDTALILRSCGLHHTEAVMKTVSPWQYALPLAPSMAAKDMTKAPKLDEVVAFCRSHADLDANTVLAEGFGGVMSPLNQGHTLRDVMQALGWPVILVGGSYLGAITHILSAYEALCAKNIPIHTVVVSESPNNHVKLEDTVATIEKFIAPHIPLVKIPRIQAEDSKWKQAPLIHWILSDEPSKNAV